uniref:Bestrophin homolog n=1 Tax=Syphacia muris TaxID=451379 RepID=A0A158R478_9BILA
MTVKYNLAVSTSKPWTLFRLLFRWSGSIWKSVFLELLVWLILFAIISVVYRAALGDSQKITFEQFVHYCDEKLDYIPLNFMLGFFVTSVLSRWLLFFDNIGYIDNVALMVSAYVVGADEKTRMLRRNIVRYCVLSQALVFRDISLRVRKRFPTIESLITAGFMMEHEKARFEEFTHFRYNRYWMPFQWSLSLCHEARMHQKIASDVLLEKIGEEIKKFRTNMAVLCNYDWVPLPIMYPQLIVMAVHTYFLVCVFSRQFVITETAPNKTEMDIYFPLMTVLQFIFYMGWLKVAEAMLNPFGEDDDDFECNFLLDKNLSIGLTVVDQGYNKTPNVQQDIFWNDEVRPLYTLQSMQEEQPRSGLTGSTANMTVKYTLDVSTSRPWSLFKLLFRWKGSVWKAISFELIVWLLLYAALTLLYRLGLEGQTRSNFEQFVAYLNSKLDYVPLDFMLGFFVTSVLNRWTLFFSNIGYIDNIALMVATYVRGTDEKTRKIRRNIVRYCVLAQTLVFRDISIRARRRFPTLDSIVESGFMLQQEQERFEEFNQFRYNRYWMPFQWALSLCDEARRQQKISSDYLLKKIGEEIKSFRTNMATLCNYDWVPLPIMYPQLIVIAVHMYFVITAISRQFITSDNAANKSKVDIYFPIMTVLQFVFYMGWLKVAEVMLNPFGEDDDDFECNFLLDKNLAIGLKIVDEGYNKTPQVLKDKFWNRAVEPLYTAQAMHQEKRVSGITGSVANIRLPHCTSSGRMVQLPEDLFSSAAPNSNRRQSLATSVINYDSNGVHMPHFLNSVKHKFGRSLSHSHVQPLSKEKFKSYYISEHGFKFPHQNSHEKKSGKKNSKVKCLSENVF